MKLSLILAAVSMMALAGCATESGTQVTPQASSASLNSQDQPEQANPPVLASQEAMPGRPLGMAGGTR